MTDYTLPREWPTYSPAQKAEWYLDARVRWHMALQHDAGMWAQFEGVEGVSRSEADREAVRNSYRDS